MDAGLPARKSAPWALDEMVPPMLSTFDAKHGADGESSFVDGLEHLPPGGPGTDPNGGGLVGVADLDRIEPAHVDYERARFGRLAAHAVPGPGECDLELVVGRERERGAEFVLAGRPDHSGGAACCRGTQSLGRSGTPPYRSTQVHPYPRTTTSPTAAPAANGKSSARRSSVGQPV